MAGDHRAGLQCSREVIGGVEMFRDVSSMLVDLKQIPILNFNAYKIEQ